jgi:acetyl-CoA carboxylase beta subunit
MTPKRQPERREASRPSVSKCPECRSAKIRATLRTPYAVYFRCDHCEHLWAVQNRLFGGSS